MIRPTRIIAVGIVLLILVISAFGQSIAAQRCTTRWNQFLRQYETHCDDGTSATEKFNPFLKQWEQEIRPGQQPGRQQQPTPTRCTKKWNAFLRQS